MEMNKALYVQYGCGWSAPDGWRNFDASPTLRFERIPVVGRLYTRNAHRFPANVKYGDIVKGLPLSAGSCAGVYCSHILEHLALDEFTDALRNTNTILAPGGVFRFVLPDLEYFVREYASNSGSSSEAAHEFMRETCLGHEKKAKSIKDIIVSWLGNSQHLWMWDYLSIAAELKKAGFVEIRRATFGDYIDPKFAEVEDKERWDNSLGVECRIPF